MSEKKGPKSPTQAENQQPGNIFENKYFIINEDSWDELISKIEQLAKLDAIRKRYKCSCSDKPIPAARFLFSIVIFMLKYNLDWKYIDRCRNECQHKDYEQISKTIHDNINYKETTEKYQRIKELASKQYPSSDSVYKFFKKLNNGNIFTEIFNNNYAIHAFFAGLDWYCVNDSDTSHWYVRYRSRKSKLKSVE